MGALVTNVWLEKLEDLDSDLSILLHRMSELSSQVDKINYEIRQMREAISWALEGAERGVPA